MSFAFIIKRYWPQFLAPLDSEKDPGFYDEILRWNKVGLVLVAALAIIGPCLSIFISVVSGKSLTLSLADSPSSYSLITDLITIALGATGLTSSFFRFGLKHGRLLVSMIALGVFPVRMVETFANYNPAMFMEIPLHIAILMFIATGIAPYRFWHVAVLGAMFYFVTDLGYRYIPPILELDVGGTPPEAISFVVVLTFFCMGIGALKYRTHYSMYRSREKIRDYAEKLEETNRELHDAQAQLVQSEKMATLGSLAAGVAHELNNPVGALTSSSDVSGRCVKKLSEALARPGTVEEASKSQRIREALAILEENQANAQRAGRRVAKIVASLASFAGLDEAELRRVDIHQGIESALALLSHLMADRITVVREFGDTPPVLCYASELNQVFMNLLKNASEAIEGTGTVRLVTSAEGNHVSIEISDNGKGMRKEQLRSLFDFQFSSQRQRVRVGMGLKVAYGIVQRHGGAIAVTSALGKGTTFVVTLPLDAAPPEPNLADTA